MAGNFATFKPIPNNAERDSAESEEESKEQNQSKPIETTQSHVPQHSDKQDSLLEKNQKVAEKLSYSFDKQNDGNYDPFKCHPRLGDLEKHKMTIDFSHNAVHHLKSDPDTLWFAQQGSLRKVFIAIKIKRISEIDNVKETFRIRFHIYLNWIMTVSEYIHYRQYIEASNDPYDYEPSWIPDLEFTNAAEIHSKEFFKYPKQGIHKVEKFQDFYIEKGAPIQDGEFDPKLLRFIRCKLECDITFAEELELQSFTFDVQDLSVIIKGNFINYLENQRYIFLPELRAANFGSIDQKYSVLDEWELNTAFVEFSNDAEGRTSNHHTRYPHIMIILKVQRKWKVYVINILFILFALTGISLSAFSLDDEDLGDRLGLLITLVLTSVAFSIVIQDKLPNVTYLTFMDKYILTSYAFLLCLIVESVLVAEIDDSDEQETYDNTLYYIFLVLWFVIFGVFYSYYAYRLRKMELEKLNMDSDEIQNKINKSSPTLKFNYKNSSRAGYNDQILSFRATASMSGRK